MPTLAELLWGIVFPSLLGFGAGLLATCRSCHGDQRRWWAGIGVLLLAIGASVPWWMAWGWKGIWPPSLFDRQAVILLSAGIVLAVSVALPRAVATLLIVLTGIGIMVPLAMRLGAWHIYLPLGLALGIIALIAERSARGDRPVSALGTLVLWLSLLAPAFVIMASAKQGQATGFIAAGLGGLWGASWFTRGAAPGAAAFAVIAAGLLMTIDQRLGDKPDTLALLLFALAPSALLLGNLPMWSRRRWTGIIVRTLGVVVIAGAGLGLAIHQPEPPPAASDDDATSAPAIDYGSYGN